MPIDAKLYFDDKLMQQTGTTRTFQTPPLPPKAEFSYEVKAEVNRDGKVLTQTRSVPFRAGDTIAVDFRTLGADEAAGEPAGPPEGWPRQMAADGYTFTAYQPQLEKWDNNRLEGRAAVSVETNASPQATFGVVWFAARTEVDKEDRMVALEDVKLIKSQFPSAPDRADAYLAALRKALPPGVRTLALDRLEANLAVTHAEAKGQHVVVKNDPPRIFYSTRPAVLVLIDGKPALRQADGTKLLRVINTRSLLLLDDAKGKYYLRLLDRWLEADALDGTWAMAHAVPAALDVFLNKVTDDPRVDLFENVAADIKDALEEGSIPTVFVSTVPAELLETEGEPSLAPVDGTKLLWVKNTTNQLLLDTADQHYYALLSGRWFRAKSLAKGPWEFVAADRLPADLAKVPETHPRGDVLSSVAGTPQAQESLIANRVPQTATVKRSEAKLEPIYDDAPRFEPIAGTDLTYAVNTPTPVICVTPSSYYACENGVWFTSSTPAGPWVAATAVPPVVYTIPPASALYYVTNVYVYGSTPDYVYFGYTPGYFGTCVCPEGVVVYGTGWVFQPWVGRYWLGRSWSYGWGARFCRTTGGWGFGFAAWGGRPWWGPVGWQTAWAGGAWNSGWRSGWGGRYSNVHINNINFNNFNVYNRWDARVHVSRGAAGGLHAGAGAPGVHKGLNNLMAGNDGHVYRRAVGGWEQHTAAGWNRVDVAKLPAQTRAKFEGVAGKLNTDWAARRTGTINHEAFRAATGYQQPLKSVHYAKPATGAPAIPHAPPSIAHPALGGAAGFHGAPGGFRGGAHVAPAGRRR